MVDKFLVLHMISDLLHHSQPSDTVAAAHRCLQVSLCQLAGLCVSVQHRAQLQVSPGLDPWRRLELKHCLQTVHAQTDLRRARCAEMFCKPEQGSVPGLRGLCAPCHPPKTKQQQKICWPLLCFQQAWICGITTSGV